MYSQGTAPFVRSAVAVAAATATAAVTAAAGGTMVRSLRPQSGAGRRAGAREPRHRSSRTTTNRPRARRARRSARRKGNPHARMQRPRMRSTALGKCEPRPSTTRTGAAAGARTLTPKRSRRPSRRTGAGLSPRHLRPQRAARPTLQALTKICTRTMGCKSTRHRRGPESSALAARPKLRTRRG